jgi:nitrogenase-stabilizing/protective protein
MTFEDLRQLSRAEEWFDALGVPYDPGALAAVRIPLLKRFGMELQAIAGLPGQDDPQRLAAARAALAFAWDLVRKPRGRSRAEAFAGPLVQLGKR